MNEFTSNLTGHKQKAELLFCSSVLTMQEAVIKECSWLRPEYFSDERLRAFWSDVLNDRKPAAEAAINRKVLQELATANVEYISSIDYPSFAQAIMDDHYLISLAGRLEPLARAISDRDQEKVNKLVQEMTTGQRKEKKEIPSAIDIALAFAETIGLDNKVMKSYITPYDNALGGYIVGTLNLLAARPGMGKTGLAFQVARNWAAAGKKVIYFSLEMNAVELWARAACGALQMPMKDYYANKLTKKQIGELVDTSARLMNIYLENLLIDDRARLTSEDIRRAVATYKPEAIVVDHLSLLKDRGETEVLRIGSITKEGKEIAKEYQVVSLYLQQLSRKVEERKDKRPVLSDLRDSGESEQNADSVTFLYRPSYYQITDHPGIISDTEIIVAKNRQGEMNVAAAAKYHLLEQWFYSKTELEEKAENIRKGE